MGMVVHAPEGGEGRFESCEQARSIATRHVEHAALVRLGADLVVERRKVQVVEPCRFESSKVGGEGRRSHGVRVVVLSQLLALAGVERASGTHDFLGVQPRLGAQDACKFAGDVVQVARVAQRFEGVRTIERPVGEGKIVEIGFDDVDAIFESRFGNPFACAKISFPETGAMASSC